MGVSRTTTDVLADYQAADDVEAADLAKLRALADTAGDPWSRSHPLHLTASALIVHPPTARVLLRWHERMNGWLQIGGHGDPGETAPADVVLREGREESGLTDLRLWPNAEVRHVVVVPVPASDREPAHQHADLRFVLATETPNDARPEKPTAPLRWLTMSDALDLVTEDNLRETLSRVERLLDAARRAGR